MTRQLFWGTLVLILSVLSGCAAPQFKPAAGHHNVAVISAINPTPIQNHVGVTIFGNSATSLDLGININQEVKATIEDALRSSGQYTLVDVPFNLQELSSAKDKWYAGWSKIDLSKPLAAILVKAAQGRNVDYLITVIDGPDSTADWGIFHHGGCDDAYVAFEAFIVDAHTGETVTSVGRRAYRRIEDLDSDKWADMPADKHAEVINDLHSIAHDDVLRALMQLGMIPDDGKPDYLAYKPSLIPGMNCVPN